MTSQEKEVILAMMMSKQERPSWVNTLQLMMVSSAIITLKIDGPEQTVDPDQMQQIGGWSVYTVCHSFSNILNTSTGIRTHINP